MSEPEEPPPPPEEPAAAAEPDPEPVPPMADPDAALREAVGANPDPLPRAPTPLPTSDEYGDDLPVAPPGRRRTLAIAAGAIFAGLAIAALVFLGRANSERYLITCATDHVTAEQGRGFPPWGSRELSGPEWKKIALPPNAECTPRETEDETELEGWYLDILIDRASATLGNKDVLDTIAPAAGSGSGSAAAPNVLDATDQQLEQALLLARSPEHRDQRKSIERLQGDIAYWRAALRLRDASGALADAAKQFDAAASRRPAHATDAAAWATFLRRVGDELHGGPAGGPPPEQFPPQPPAQTPQVPAGVALPVEPAAGSAAEPPPPAIDAGVPTGGVLL